MLQTNSLFGYPFRIDGRGRLATASEEEHIHQMIEQVLFVLPGERVNRADFGTGVQQLIFAPNSEELAAATEFLIKAALEQWLGDLIEVDEVGVVSEDATLQITILYTIRRTQEQKVAELSPIPNSEVG
ncbi:GPW/gp25 family protein [Kovacikia minuta CCNUW1]|uniref:GPW/gp25 family protein n=1 Tax=Kovacikia minuta TaxID=2931930 RepID=UPI001CCDEDD3|nr:GPW/gp25 family protein [Kovacikia minuta]UBF28587.1 GPW/gp25 family protein [Kovacikia minuta CCNUW1]